MKKISSRSNSQPLDVDPQTASQAQISQQPGQANPTGIANIPNQIHYLNAKRKLNVNIMLFGENGLGKTGFINHVLGSPIFVDDVVENNKDSDAMIRVRRQELEENGTSVLLSLVDLPEFGFNLNKRNAGKAALAYLEDQFVKNLLEDSKHRRQRNVFESNDSRTHSVLYFHNPCATRLSNLDLELIKKMNQVANVIIIVAKGDTLLRHEYNRIRGHIREQLEGTPIFNDGNEPFLVVNGADLSVPNPARNYFWGSIKIAPNSQNGTSMQFNTITNLLFKNFLPELILKTEDKYESWRVSVLHKMNVSEEEWKEPADVLNRLATQIQNLKLYA